MFGYVSFKKCGNMLCICSSPYITHSIFYMKEYVTIALIFSNKHSLKNFFLLKQAINAYNLISLEIKFILMTLSP